MSNRTNRRLPLDFDTPCPCENKPKSSTEELPSQEEENKTSDKLETSKEKDLE